MNIPIKAHPVVKRSTYQLIECDLWPFIVEHEPPGGSCNCGYAHINPNGEVPEEEPATDERVPGGTRRLLHYVHVRWVEAKSGGRQSIGDQVDPEQLHGNEGLGKSQSSRQKDAGGREG